MQASPARLWLSASVLSSSYGFPVVAGVALFFLLTRRRLPALVSLIVPPIVFMTVRLITGGEYAQQQPVATGRIPLYIHYVQSGLSSVGEAILGLDALGVASFAAITVASLLLVTDDRTRAFIVAMLVAIVVFYFEASLSRSVFGPDQARAATRYTFFCGVLAVCMIAAAWGQRRIEKRWVPIVVVLAIVSFANNIAWLGDGSDYYTTRMEISRARLAVGFGIIDRNLTFYAPDPEFAGDLTDDRLGSVIASRYDDEFMVEANRCVDHWNNELARAGIADDAIDDQQRAALLVSTERAFAGRRPAWRDLGCARRPRRPERRWQRNPFAVPRVVCRPGQRPGRLARFRADDATLRPRLGRLDFARHDVPSRSTQPRCRAGSSH